MPFAANVALECLLKPNTMFQSAVAEHVSKQEYNKDKWKVYDRGKRNAKNYRAWAIETNVSKLY